MVVFKKKFPKQHLQDAGKSMGKQLSLLVKTENIPQDSLRKLIFYNKFVGKTEIN